MPLLQSDREIEDFFALASYFRPKRSPSCIIFTAYAYVQMTGILSIIYSKCNYALLCQSIMALMADLDQQQQQKSISILDLIMTNDIVNH